MLRVLVFLTSVLGLVSGHPLGAQTAETCNPDGDVKFVCGTTNPEDLYAGAGRPLGNRVGTLLRFGRSRLRGGPS